RLHLSGRHRKHVSNRAQRGAAADADGGTPVLKAEVGAHQCQRIGDTAHGPAVERIVACQYRVEWLARQYARQKAHRGSRVATVERLDGCLQAFESASVDEQALVLSLDADPEQA